MTELEWLASMDPQVMLHWLRTDGNTDQGMMVPHPSDRKLRLFVCACCRQVWHLLTDERSRQAVEVAERYADALATDAERKLARGNAMKVSGWVNACGADTAAKDNSQVQTLTKRLRHHAEQMSSTQANLLHEIIGNPYQPILLPWRCSCCNIPCGPPTPGHYCVKCGAEEAGSCPWFTPEVLILAQAAYTHHEQPCDICNGAKASINHPAGEVRGSVCRECNDSGCIDNGTLDPIRLMVLADALEEVGCPQSHSQHKFSNTNLLDHLRSPGPHVPGCWAVDLILGKS